MDINDLHIGVTVMSLGVFIAIFAYSWSRKRQTEYEEAQCVPFLDQDGDTPDAGVKQ